MNRVFALSSVLALTACASVYGDGKQVGTKNGKPLYRASCTVDLSTAGEKGMFGTGTVPVYGVCEVAASNRCPSGYKIEDAKRSNFRRITETFQNGPYVQRRNYPAQDVELLFTCKA